MKKIIISRVFSRLLSSNIISKSPNLKNAPNLKEFLRLNKNANGVDSTPSSSEVPRDGELIFNRIPSVTIQDVNLSFYIETYGCQMNASDSEIIKSILVAHGHTPCEILENADVVLTNTCAIRENAENKVWHRLQYFQSLRAKNKKIRTEGFPLVGVLGCMAERLKTKLLEGKGVDFVCGPDAYRDLPRLLESVLSSGQKEANTRLSLDETYADVAPVRKTGTQSAYVSIMRGCNNMCSFCIVPFTRGRERSRERDSILKEVQQLADEGVREVVLLGQNVNGYHDISLHAKSKPLSDTQESLTHSTKLMTKTNSGQSGSLEYKSTPGFKNLFQSRIRQLSGTRFAELLMDVASICPEMRVRFTSPHPKDFPPDVLSVIAETYNICKSIHMPVQSGSSSTLSRMRRGYTREAFLSLVQDARTIIPGVCLSTDVIAGFCGETEEEHNETVSLMREVTFDQAFMFAYSLREKTHAAYAMKDDVPEDVKLRRLQEIIATFRTHVIARNRDQEHGRIRLVLVEGYAARSSANDTPPMMTGRTDGNKRVVFNAPAGLLPQFGMDLLSRSFVRDEIIAEVFTKRTDMSCRLSHAAESYMPVESLQGRYVVVHIGNEGGSTLRGSAVGTSTLSDFHRLETASVFHKHTMTTLV